MVMCEPTQISMTVITDLWLTHKNLLISSKRCSCPVWASQKTADQLCPLLALLCLQVTPD